MAEPGEREPLLLGNQGHYLFDRNADERQRLEQQFETMREDFNLWFDQALRMGRLPTDPDRADWWLLDVGCGEGQYGLEALARYPKAHLVGTDVNPAGIAAAVRAASDLPNARFLVHDSRHPMPPGTGPEAGFDIAVGWYFLYFMTDPKRTLADIVAMLRPGGVLMFCNVPDDAIIHPDPVVTELTDALMVMGRRVHMFDVARDIEGWLREMGFESIRTVSLTYPLGGATAHGQRWWAGILGVLAGSRRVVVDVGGLMSGSEFDHKLDQIAGRPFLSQPGRVRYPVTLARKPASPG
jgi:SAM-dependent methyltransferase